MAVSCVNHIAEQARFDCLVCKKKLCRQCAKHEWSGQGFADRCVHCNADLAPIVGRTGRAKPSASIGDRLVDSAMYMVEKSVLVTVIGLAALSVPMYGLAQGSMFGLLVGFFMFGIEIGVYFHIVQSTALGVKTLEHPDFRNLWDDVYRPGLRYLAALVPMLASFVWYLADSHGGAAHSLFALARDPTDLLTSGAPGLLFVLSVILWPLLTMIAAMSQSILEMYNPLVWIKTLALMKTDYLIGTIAFYAVAAFDVFILGAVRLQLALSFDVVFVTAFLIALTTYLPMALRARILGAICEPYTEAR